MGAGLPDTGITNVPVYSGLYALSIGDDSLKEYNQVIATVPGATYIFSYAYQSDGEAGAPSSLQTWFGDQLAQSLGEIAGQNFVPATSQFRFGDFWWNVYSGSFAATGATTLIRLLAANSHPDFYYIGLDAVSVVQANSVPVPGTPALLGLGMILGVVWSRRAT
ncbi:PEP-CTERM sorting domain-containing protein [Methylomagnum sp.]